MSLHQRVALFARLAQLSADDASCSARSLACQLAGDLGLSEEQVRGGRGGQRRGDRRLREGVLLVPVACSAAE